MVQKYEREPGLGAGLNLLNLFGLDSTTARVWGASIAVLIITYFFIRVRYPCRSTSSLAKVVDRASNLFDECHTMRAFRGGEYDRYHMILQLVTSCATEIASRTYTDQSDDAPRQMPSFHRDYFEKTSFLWERLKDIVKCHREARLLIRSLEVCLVRASHSYAQYQLLQRASVSASPQALPHSNTETLRVADGYDVDAV